MIEIAMIMTSQNCLWSSKNLASMVPLSEIASQHESDSVILDE